MRGYINAYTNNGNHAQVTLDNLNVNYPNGYKIITYLGGANQNSGASISLTEVMRRAGTLLLMIHIISKLDIIRSKQ